MTEESRYVWIKCLAIWSWERDQYECVFLDAATDDDGEHYESCELYLPALETLVWKEDE